MISQIGLVNIPIKIRYFLDCIINSFLFILMFIHYPTYAINDVHR